MPIGNIPAPKDFGTSFNEGFATSQKMFDSIANRKNQEAMVNIHQQERDQAKALLPYLIQKYQDDHSLTPLQRDHLSAQIHSAHALATLHESNAGVNDFLMGKGRSSGNQPAAISSYQNTESQEAPVTGTPNPNASSMGRRELVQIANNDQANYDAQHGINNPAQSTNMRDQFIFPVNKGQNQTRPPMLSPHNQQKMQQPMQQANAVQAPMGVSPTAPKMQALEDKMTQGGFKRGQIEVVKPATPGLEHLDEAAQKGLHTQNFKPEIERKTEDGIQTTIYPSGKVTVQKISPSLEEKAEIDIDKAGRKEQTKKNIGESAKIEESTKTLVKSAHLLKGLNDLLKENPKLTGPGTGVATKFKLSNSGNAGTFITKAARLQAELGKLASQRGGAQVLKWAENVKPDIWNQPQVNIGMIKGAAEEIMSDYLDSKASWENKNPGKKFPVEMPDVSAILNPKSKVTRQHVTEENIVHTMEETGLSREEVEKRLRKKGLL